MFPLFNVLRDLGISAPKGVIQVGASFGQEISWFADNGVTAGLFIEPLPEPFMALSKECSKRSNFIAINALCSDRSGEKVSFHVASNDGQSSSMFAPKNHLKVFDHVSFDKKIEVVSSRLDTVVDVAGCMGSVAVCDALDLLYMDVQGAELKVLLGAGQVLNKINVVVTEVTRNQLYDGAAQLDDLARFLGFHGFDLNNINFGLNHHADALFIRRSLLRIQ